MSNLSSTGSKTSPGQRAVRHVTVAPDQAGQRLDNFLLRELKGLPRSRVYRLVRKGEVRVNLGRVSARYRLCDGDRVRIPPVRRAAPAAGAPSQALDTGRVLFEDAHLLVLDKPSGVSVHGGTGVRTGLIEALRARRPELPFLELVHRLDRGTSGCLLLAKSGAALRGLHAALRGESGDVIGKRYAALVGGELGTRPVHVSASLRRRSGPAGERLVRVAEEGDAAESVFHPQISRPGCSRVEIELLTGRTHQARAHAAYLGHPIVGDDKYGDRALNKRLRRAGVNRLALHARELVFIHPVTGEPCRVQAPPPAIFDTLFAGDTR